MAKREGEMDETTVLSAGRTSSISRAVSQTKSSTGNSRDDLKSKTNKQSTGIFGRLMQILGLR